MKLLPVEDSQAINNRIRRILVFDQPFELDKFVQFRLSQSAARKATSTIP